MRRPLAAALALISALAALPPPAAGVERSDFLLPGRWLRGSTDGGRVWLLTADGPDQPRTLLALDLRRRSLETVATGLPAEVVGVVPAPEAWGGRLLLPSGRGFFTLDPVARRLQPVTTGGSELLAGPAAGAFATAAPPWVAVARLGEARELLPAAGVPAPGPAQALAVTAEREGWGLRLRSPPLRYAGRWLVSGPRQEGRRLVTLLLGPGGERLESRSLLPAPEQVAESAVVLVGDRPYLVVGTFRGVGPAANKLLRVFPLAAGGEGAGTQPLVALQLPSKMWHEVRPLVADADGDGHPDLLVAANEGFAGRHVTVALFRGSGGGAISRQPAMVNVELGAGAWRHGDVTGDGRPDLVTLRRGRLAIYAAGADGLPAKSPTRVLELGEAPEPRREETTVSVSVSTEGGETEVTRSRDSGGASGWGLLDVDGDGTQEVLRWSPADGGRILLTVVAL